MTRAAANPRIGSRGFAYISVEGKDHMAIDQGVRAEKETRADVHTVIDLAHKQGLKIVDLKFIDLIGTWQHLSIPVAELRPSLSGGGLGFHGCSFCGFSHI